MKERKKERKKERHCNTMNYTYDKNTDDVNLDQLGIQKVKMCLVLEWFSFQTVGSVTSLVLKLV
jgi:hypothetical protein